MARSTYHKDIKKRKKAGRFLFFRKKNREVKDILRGAA